MASSINSRTRGSRRGRSGRAGRAGARVALVPRVGPVKTVRRVRQGSLAAPDLPFQPGQQRRTCPITLGGVARMLFTLVAGGHHAAHHRRPRRICGQSRSEIGHCAGHAAADAAASGDRRERKLAAPSRAHLLRRRLLLPDRSERLFRWQRHEADRRVSGRLSVRGRHARALQHCVRARGKQPHAAVRATPRGRAGGTVGSRTPSFPIERDVEASAASGRFGIPPGGERLYRTAADVASSQRGAGSLVCCACIPTTPCVPNIASGSQAEGSRPFAPTSIQSIPGPTSNDGIWVEFNGSRWSSRGSAVAFDPNQFTVAGMYRDVPVYQRRGGSDREIFIPSVAGGLLAPFQRQ